MLACSQCHEDTVHLLLQSGADPSVHTSSGRTALMYSAQSDRCSNIVRCLLEAGAVVNAQDKIGWSALAIGCKSGCYRLVELLIQYGADVQLSTIHQYTPLMVACEHRHENIAALLLNHSLADPNLQDEIGFTALMIACQQQLTQTVSLLLSSGADPNLQNNCGQTALMISCVTWGSLELDNSVPLLLVSAGADPNTQDKHGSTALMIAVHHEYISGVRILLNTQAHVNIQNTHGYTALRYSAFTGNLTITELLLSAGANSSLVNIHGRKALDLALCYNHVEVCQLLLMHTDTKPHPPLDKSASTEGYLHTEDIVQHQNTSSSSTRSPSNQLDQLHIALHHPLPPTVTSKHEYIEEEDVYEETHVKRYH